MALSGAGQEQAPCAGSLAALVREAFPDLALTSLRLDQSGGDHVLLIADEHFAFRFPRSGVGGLSLEIAVLRQLQQRSAMATPAYQFVDPRGRFGGYALIAGSALTPARLKALPPPRQDDILRTAALFLTELHGLPPERVAPPQQWPSTWTPAQFADRGLTQYLCVAAALFPAHAPAVEAFYTRYAELQRPCVVVVHGDLVADHVLLDERSGQLSGIIDFGDVALGDPAQDFLGLWAYGAAAARRVVELYRPGVPDPGLLGRSRDHFIRYGLDRLLGGMLDAGGAPFDLIAIAVELAELLDFARADATWTARSRVTH